jgi:hypothetical protein
MTAEIRLNLTFAQARIMADVILSQAKNHAQSIRYYRKDLEEKPEEDSRWQKAELKSAEAKLAELNTVVVLFGYDPVTAEKDD